MTTGRSNSPIFLTERASKFALTSEERRQSSPRTKNRKVSLIDGFDTAWRQRGAEVTAGWGMPTRGWGRRKLTATMSLHDEFAYRGLLRCGTLFLAAEDALAMVEAP